MLVTVSQGHITRVPGVRIPCPRVTSPKAQGPSSIDPGSQGPRVLESQVSGLRVPGPGSQVLILNYAVSEAVVRKCSVKKVFI